MRGKVSQWEVVEVNFQLPNGRFLPHPALIISSNELFEDEEFFYAILMTTKNIFPKYTLEITPEMLTKTSDRQSYFATHIIGQFDMNSILQKRNTFLKEEFRAILQRKIIKSVFG
jgi:hypothetical protein